MGDFPEFSRDTVYLYVRTRNYVTEYQQFLDEMLDLHNLYRKYFGAEPLKWDENVSNVIEPSGAECRKHAKRRTVSGAFDVNRHW